MNSESQNKRIWRIRCNLLTAKIVIQRWNEIMQVTSQSIRRLNVVIAHFIEQTDPKNENNSEVNRIGDYLNATKNE